MTIGARAQAPRPHAEAPLARRTAIVAFVFFLASTLALAWHGVNLGSLQRTFSLYALGGFSILIFGTSRLLIAGMAGRDMAGGAASALITVVPAAIGAVGLYVARDAPPTVRAALAMLWAAGALAHVVVTILTVRQPPTRPPVTDPTATKASRVPIRMLEAASLLYALGSAILVPLAYAGRVSLASALHVVLVGFVITTIMSTAAHILPRFTRARAPTALLALLVPFALAGPALMGFGLHGRRGLLAAGAVVEGTAFLLFGVVVIVMMARAHRFRWPNLAYAAAPVAIAIGGLLGLSFATTGGHASQLATHGLLNVYGFVGLFVIAASTDIYGPALDAGAKPAKRHALVTLTLTLGGLGVAALGTSIGLEPAARGGMLLYAAGLAWQLLGISASHRRAGRVLARFRT